MSQKSVIAVEKNDHKDLKALSQRYGIPSKEAEIDSMVPKQTISKEFTLVIAFYLGPGIQTLFWTENCPPYGSKMDLHFVFAGTAVFVDN